MTRKRRSEAGQVPGTDSRVAPQQAPGWASDAAEGYPFAAQPTGRPLSYGMSAQPAGVARAAASAAPMPGGGAGARAASAAPPDARAVYGAPATSAQAAPYAPGYGAYAGFPAQAAYQPPRTSVPPEEQRRKKRGCAFWVAIVLALLAVAVAVLLAFTLMQPKKADRSGDLGQLEGKSPGEIQAELDRVIEEGMFNISIASVVEFADGASSGELRIENVPNNNYLMRVSIAREDTGEQLYQTDVIEPNHHIQADTLDVDLPPGSYECVATFHALDPETEDEVGQVAAALKINVLG